MSEKPNYGLDAPDIIKRWGMYGVFGLVISILLNKYLSSNWVSSVITTISFGITFMFLMPAVTIPFGSIFLKFKDREWLFKHLDLKGSENVLDVGCGHGLLLIGAAKRLTTGKSHGLDLWAQEDQANNSKEATLKNAKIEGVDGKIEIHNGDMRKMPFPDSNFDAIVSSWAIHNIYDKTQREIALAEIIRVLKPGGRIAILDIDHAPSYKKYFAANGLKDVKLLGPRFTFGNRTYLVSASKSF